MIAIVVMFEPSRNRRLSSPRNPIGIACVVVALWSLSACTVIDPPSGALACTASAECDVPRVCELGYCVVPQALLPDADPTLPDADPNLPDADPIDPDADLSCNAIALVDAFANTAATPLWAEQPSGGISLTEAGGVLTMGIPGLLLPPQYAGYISTASYDMRGHSFFIEIPTMMNTSSIGEASLSIESSAIDKLTFRQKLGSLSVDLIVGGATTPVVAATYNATAHRWWRVVEAGGTISVQASANGTTWTPLGTVATPAFFSSVKVAIGVRGFNAGAIPGDTVFDNANGGGVVPACP
jgi:hypothetical protein